MHWLFVVLRTIVDVVFPEPPGREFEDRLGINPDVLRRLSQR